MENSESKTKHARSTTIEGEGKTIAIIAYITLIGLIVAFVMNNEKKDPFATYHIKQSLGLGLTGLALSTINIIPILGWIVSFLGFFVIVYMWIISLLNALNGKQKPAPILGKKYEEWFKNM
ncbi:hypothetical protein JBL43_07045 [Aureibaculum sp. A20]|uniref:DUF4870 domain-containing protein n=1 Tax=Aureibaculum flavum TaxID=2795986 RepID=A0ABS0WPS0_9FLAO|nr:hypothetical protein [Aureibaculum flavum]MBJ2173987.1 hypothetical protein [Aureibaculum flavum]